MRRRAERQEDDPPGAPEWMLTFSDCMTLLLTFFVLLVSFSSFDVRVFHRLKAIFGEARPAVTITERDDMDALLSKLVIEYPEEVTPGSEYPTLETSRQVGAIEETSRRDFRNRKVFVIPSGRIFWGGSSAISRQGRSSLNAAARFIKSAYGKTCRVVVSENGPDDEETSRRFGLPRAWTVMNYLTKKQRLDKNVFSISAATMLQRAAVPSERVLEITILERSIYE